MKNKYLVCLLACFLALSAAGQAFGAGKLIVYTSMKESLIGKLRDAFVKQHPDLAMDYQAAGAGKLMAKIAAERESGKILADVLWTSEVPDFYKMKEEGLLEKYTSPMVAELINPFDDFDGSFTAARLGTLGIAYNTRLIKSAPTSWSDLAKAEFKGAFGIANPSLSGTSYMSVALLAQEFGWEFFNKLHANGARVGKGSGQVIDDTASGDLVASLAVDYITFDKIGKGASMALAYPQEMLVVPSPVAIIKGSPNLDAAKKFVDFLLSREGQSIIAAEGTLPARADVATLTDFLPAVSDAARRAIKINYQGIMTDKERIVKQFMDTMQGKK